MKDLSPDDWKQIETVVANALLEDCVSGDITTTALIPSHQMGRACLVANDEGIVAGINVFSFVFRCVDTSLQVKDKVAEGRKICHGEKLVIVEGELAGILRAERVALNFVQRLSGIATETARYVAAVADTGAYIADTRKTTPGLRSLEKYAVRVGGGRNHRMNLGDGVLIKDNHLIALRAQGVGLEEAIGMARRYGGSDAQIEVEVESVGQVRQALSAGADIIMLDNMSIGDIRSAVDLVGGKALIEASGGINLHNVRDVAETGVDLISIGALTHSVRSLDMSLDIEV